jgi:hypothetical protein
MVHHRLTTGPLARSFNDYKPLRIQCTLKAKQPNPGAVIIILEEAIEGISEQWIQFL